MTRLFLTPISLACSLLALGLSACASVQGATNTDLVNAIKEVARDPNCGHTDRIDIDLNLTGPRGKLFLERQCPMPVVSLRGPLVADDTSPPH